VTDQALLERVALVDAECALSARQPLQAEAALGPALDSEDGARRSRAELLAGQASSLRLDYDAAVRHFERSRETAARPARARVLSAADRPADAGRAIAALTGPEFAAERADLLTRLATAGGAAAASAALDGLLARGKHIPVQEQAQLLIADADRQFAAGDYQAATARYRRAAAIAPAASSEAGLATLGTQRVLLTATRNRADVKPIETELARLSLEPGAVVNTCSISGNRRRSFRRRTPRASVPPSSRATPSPLPRWRARFSWKSQAGTRRRCTHRKRSSPPSRCFLNATIRSWAC
jgi:hypothetical protein